MEHKSLWKNFLLLTVAGLVTLHLNVSQAADSAENSNASPDASEECVLHQE